MTLVLRQNFISVQYLGINWTEFHQIYLFAFILIGSTLGFVHIIRDMALDLRQNFVSAQYLENKLTDFDQTLYNYLY